MMYYKMYDIKEVFFWDFLLFRSIYQWKSIENSHLPKIWKKIPCTFIFGKTIYNERQLSSGKAM